MIKSSRRTLSTLTCIIFLIQIFCMNIIPQTVSAATQYLYASPTGGGSSSSESLPGLLDSAAGIEEETSATTGTGLLGKYYNDMDFTDLKVSRTDATVNFSWGTDSPDASIANTRYSAHWSGQVEPQYSEKYTFYTSVDDGVRLFINGQAVIDKFILGSSEYSGTIALTAGTKYDIDLYYYNNTGNGAISLSWSSNSQAKQVIPQNRLYTPADGTGLKGEYFSGSNFASLDLTRTDSTIDFNWGANSPGAPIGSDNYSVRWTGMVEPLYTETYTFYTNSDDGVRLWINGVKLIDNWTTHTVVENSGTIALAAGNKYDVRIEYYEGTGDAAAQFSWSSASQTKQIVPVSQLYLPSTGLDSADPFKVYLTGNSPTIVTDLGSETKGSATVSNVVFQSRQVDTATGLRDTQVYAVIARPTAEGTYPGILVLHGGGGKCEKDKAITWAQRGYVAVAIDLPGICNPANAPDSSGLWKDYAYGAKHFSVNPDITASSIFDAEVAVMQALYLLRSQPTVNTSKIGVIGISWGGYSTTFVSSLAGNLVNAAFSLYGSGFFDYGSAFEGSLNNLSAQNRTAWLRYLDAGRRAKGMTANYFACAAANDTFFHPPAVTATLNEIRSPKNLIFSPNTDHFIGQLGGNTSVSNNWTKMEISYFKYQLAGDPAFPTMSVNSAVQQGDGSVLATFNVQSPAGIRLVKAYYSVPAATWKLRTWTGIDATSIGGGQYQAVIPSSVISQNGHWYGLISDTRPVTVCTSIQPELFGVQISVPTPTPTPTLTPTLTPTPEPTATPTQKLHTYSKNIYINNT